MEEYEFNRIDKEVKTIERLVDQFCGLQCRSSHDIRRAFRKIERIRTRHQSTLSRINNLKDELNGEKQRLGLQRDQSYQESKDKLGRVATQAQRLSENWSEQPPLTNAFQGFGALVQFALAHNDYQTSWSSQDSLDALPNKLLELTRQQDKLQDLLDDAEAAYGEMEDAVEDTARRTVDDR